EPFLEATKTRWSKEEKVNDTARQLIMHHNVSLVDTREKLRSHIFIQHDGISIYNSRDYSIPRPSKDGTGCRLLESGVIYYPCKDGGFGVWRELSRIKNNDHLINPLVFAVSYFMTSKSFSHLKMERMMILEPEIRTICRSPISFAVGYAAYRVIKCISEKRAEEDAFKWSDKVEILDYRQSFQDQLDEIKDFHTLIDHPKIGVITRTFLKGFSVFTNLKSSNLESKIERANKYLADREKSKEAQKQMSGNQA
ncbi:MAG TPA: hypothetical protein VLG49_00075, partial [Rhabdochlamydiaceae bacterium]|nr:hypothetical protein [Rhabdochlamydiaceae bacterium]